ncbi:hypothetical protein [Streptosporangium sp. NPDC051022]|uniref:hypothetical protein n=1 Tax=Streptosporangium sp. NPDC051022 TaxID=3155752 RepID=UPI0034496C2E
MSAVPPRPPLVLYGSRTAWLQAWRRGEYQRLALIFWDASDDYRRYVVERWVPAADIVEIEGENYARVPRLHTPLSDS